MLLNPSFFQKLTADLQDDVTNLLQAENPEDAEE